MTEVTYRALSEAAVEELTKLSALGVRSEDIVMVVTQDVFWAASVYEPLWNLTHNVQQFTVAARFYGHDVGVINEEAGTMFRPAIKGMRSFEGMEPGTLIAVNGDEHGQACIYSMEQYDRLVTQFRDIGLTVSFGYGQERAMAAADIATGTVADMLADELQLPFTPGVTTRNPMFNMEPMFPDYQWIPSRFERFQISESPKTRTIGSVDIKPKKQAEVKPDTTALDEFLSSFKILKSAT